MTSPFGTVYNPISLHRQLTDAWEAKSFDSSEIVQHNGLWKNLQTHSSFASPQQDELERVTLQLHASVREGLHRGRWLFITYGTAWVYDHRSSGQIVANCHKLPGNGFSKRLLSPEEIIKSFDRLHQIAQERNPKLQMMLTLSPVRHVRDSLALNQLSKSVLRYSLHQIIEKPPEVIPELSLESKTQWCRKGIDIHPESCKPFPSFHGQR